MSPATANLVQPEVQSVRPTIPDRLDDLGITRSLVSDLIRRYLWLHGSGTLAMLNERLKLSFPVLEVMFHQFRQQHILEVKGMLGNDYAFSLTSGGRALATARNEVCQYVGPAPEAGVRGRPGVSLKARGQVGFHQQRIREKRQHGRRVRKREQAVRQAAAVTPRIPGL